MTPDWDPDQARAEVAVLRDRLSRMQRQYDQLIQQQQQASSTHNHTLQTAQAETERIKSAFMQLEAQRNAELQQLTQVNSELIARATQGESGVPNIGLLRLFHEACGGEVTDVLESVERALVSGSVTLVVDALCEFFVRENTNGMWMKFLREFKRDVIACKQPNKLIRFRDCIVKVMIAVADLQFDLLLDLPFAGLETNSELLRHIGETQWVNDSIHFLEVFVSNILIDQLVVEHVITPLVKRLCWFDHLAKPSIQLSHDECLINSKILSVLCIAVTRSSSPVSILTIDGLLRESLCIVFSLMLVGLKDPQNLSKNHLPSKIFKQCMFLLCRAGALKTEFPQEIAIAIHPYGALVASVVAAASAVVKSRDRTEEFISVVSDFIEEDVAFFKELQPAGVVYDKEVSIW
jgi:hypothetical protein